MTNLFNNRVGAPDTSTASLGPPSSIHDHGKGMDLEIHLPRIPITKLMILYQCLECERIFSSSERLINSYRMSPSECILGYLELGTCLGGTALAHRPSFWGVLNLSGYYICAGYQKYQLLTLLYPGLPASLALF
jgi:hypothetical protein